MTTFRNNRTRNNRTNKLPNEGASSFVGRSIKEGSPSAILAGVVLHNRQMRKQIKPVAFRRMDPLVSIALQCDLTGTDAEIKARMKEAGLTGAEVKNLWSVTDLAFKAARKCEIDKRYKMTPADADQAAFNVAQTALVGFLKEDDSSQAKSGEAFR